MKDEQWPTRASAEDEGLDADALRIALGRRLRTARTALGLSQQAVADAMRSRGFNWRQTTVAKTEAADRPTLFTEVVALSTILKRELGFFLSGRTALDEIKEETAREVRSTEELLSAVKSQLAHAEMQHASALVRRGVALAINEFSYTLDSSELKQSFETFSQVSAFTVPEIKRILDAAGIPPSVLERVDATALRVAAQAIQREGGASDDGLAWHFSKKEASELVTRYLAGEETPSYFADFLRSQPAYKQDACRMLIDEVIEHVESRKG